MLAKRLPFPMPYNLGCNALDQVTLLHRDGLAIYDSGGIGPGPIAEFCFPSRPAPATEAEQEDREEQDSCEHRERRQVFTEASAILQLSGPCGVATDADGRVLLLDYSRDRVQLVSRDGAVIASCRSGGQSGMWFSEEDVRFGDAVLEPCQGAVDDAGNLAVVHSDCAAIAVYSLQAVYPPPPSSHVSYSNLQNLSPPSSQSR